MHIRVIALDDAAVVQERTFNGMLDSLAAKYGDADSSRHKDKSSKAAKRKKGKAAEAAEAAAGEPVVT